MPLANRIVLGFLGLALNLSSAATAGEVVAVVSSRCPETALGKNQVADIFLGRASRFPDGNEAVPIDQAESSAARDAFYAAFTGKSPAQVKAHWSKIIFTGRGQPPREVSNGIEVKKFVVRNPHAIGYIDRKLVDDSVKVLRAQ